MRFFGSAAAGLAAFISSSRDSSMLHRESAVSDSLRLTRPATALNAWKQINHQVPDDNFEEGESHMYPDVPILAKVGGAKASYELVELGLATDKEKYWYPLDYVMYREIVDTLKREIEGDEALLSFKSKVESFDVNDDTLELAGLGAKEYGDFVERWENTDAPGRAEMQRVVKKYLWPISEQLDRELDKRSQNDVPALHWSTPGGSIPQKLRREPLVNPNSRPVSIREKIEKILEPLSEAMRFEAMKNFYHGIRFQDHRPKKTATKQSPPQLPFDGQIIPEENAFE